MITLKSLNFKDNPWSLDEVRFALSDIRRQMKIVLDEDEPAIQDLQTDMVAAQADIVSLQASRTADEADIDDLQTDMTAAQGDIVDLQAIAAGYGQIYKQSADTGFSISTTPVSIANYDTNGPTGSGATSDQANKKITALTAGVWEVYFETTIQLNSAAAEQCSVEIYKNNAGTGFKRAFWVNTANEGQPVSLSAFLTLAANDYIQAFIATPSSATVSVVRSTLKIKRIA